MTCRGDVYGLFNDSFPPVIDGVTLTVQNYVASLSQSGRKVTVVTPWNPVTPPSDGFELLRYFSLPIYNRSPYRYGYPKLDARIWHRLRHQNFRIVHSHSPFSSGRLALYSARHHKVPLVGTFHSKYRTDLEHSLPGWMIKIIMRRILDFFNSCDEVWIPQAGVEETARAYGFKGELVVMPNGDDLASTVASADVMALKDASRRELGIGGSTISLLFVGQHIRQKGVDLILEALHRLPAGFEWRMDFIGKGYFADQMKDMTREYGIAERVRLHGQIPEREALRRHYAAADLFLLPSMYDNAPLVVREAASMGTPALLPKGSTSAEVIADGVNGYLTDRTAQAYADAIVGLGADRKRLREVGMNARNTLVRTWPDVMAEVNDRYDNLIKRYDRHQK